ncbi:hypothetical protein [Vreelandella sp. H-I2]
MEKLITDPHVTQQMGNGMMLLGLLLLVNGALGGYIWHGYLNISLQVLAHMLIILGPTLIKVGYVVRINARHRLHLAY